jgi:hypothetical protein
MSDNRKTYAYWIGTILTLISLLVAIVIAFNTVDLKAEANRCDIIELKQDVKYIDEIRYNLRALCEKQGVTYIPRGDK